MSASHLVFTTQIAGPAQTIFDLVADMPNYGRWLPGSEAFGATTQVTPYPVRLGTTYLDAGSLGLRPGSVTEFDPPRRLGFHHTMLLKKGPLMANLDIHIHYAFEPAGKTTNVVRALDFTIEMPLLFRLVQPIIVSGLRKENLRTLAELKRYVESLSQQARG
ncbi:MAG: SRPBCC family protein [Acidobacteriaceae bacterium]